MKLHAVKNPASLPYLERFVNKRGYSAFSEFSAVSPEYRPQANTAAFPVPVAIFPASDVSVLQINPRRELRDYYLRDGKVQFPIHPDIFYDGSFKDEALESARGQRVENVAGEPLAATRTLLVNEPVAHYIKLHLPKRISRFNRRLRNVGITNSLAVAKDIMESGLGEQAFAFLPETIGVWHKRAKWGFIVRECEPLPVVGKRRFLIPYFSLYAPDAHASKDKPLLVQLVEHHQATPLDFILARIVAPLIASWVAVARTLGIVLAPHGENALLELDENYEPTRIVHRDFLGLDVDPVIRQERGLSLVAFTKYVMPEALPERQKRYSHIYDYQIGHHLFSSIAGVLEAHYGLRTERFQAAVRTCFHAEIRELAPLFPKTTYCYPARAFPNNQGYIVEANEPPLWR